MDIFEYDDYREILKGELIRRIKQNPSYSQGAFARDISLSPSRLSEILSGKQGLSLKAAMDIAKGLRLSSDEQDFFASLVESQHGRSRLARETSRLRLQKFRHKRRIEPIQSELLHTLSSWYHLAILELEKLKDFRPDPLWISAQLGIELKEATDALLALSKLGLLGSKGNLDDAKEPTILHGLSSCGVVPIKSDLHTQVLDLVRSRLNGYDRSKQGHCSFMVAIDADKLDQILPLIQETIENLLIQLDEQSENKDQLYLFSANFLRCHGQASQHDGTDLETN